MKVYHPTAKGISVEIPDAKFDEWAEQGWLRSWRTRKTAKKAAARKK